MRLTQSRAPRTIIRTSKPGWINGTLVKSSSPNIAGNIVLAPELRMPYQKELLRLARAGARAIVTYRDRSDVAGHAMYYLDYGVDERELVIPVVEVYERFKGANSLWRRFDESGVAIRLWPEENMWKKANDASAFQIVCNVVLSALQMGIIATGAVRLLSWHHSAAGLYAIGPVCIFLECVASAIRCGATFVDPFLTFRTMPATPGLILITAAFPFQLSCGILLTFYWSETLHSNKISAAPFISEYRKSAITAVVVLFICELVTSTTRVTLRVAERFNPAYFSQALYVIVAIALTISYIACAVQIHRRVKNASSSPPRKFLRNLTLRFTLSTAGYILLVSVIISSIWAIGYPWGWKICFNLLFLAANITGSLQIYSFVPPRGKRSSNSGGSTPASQVSV